MVFEPFHNSKLKVSSEFWDFNAVINIYHPVNDVDRRFKIGIVVERRIRVVQGILFFVIRRMLQFCRCKYIKK
jgi:hypothetical protein